jgi:hypothetical protein
LAKKFDAVKVFSDYSTIKKLTLRNKQLLKKPRKLEQAKYAPVIAKKLAYFAEMKERYHYSIGLTYKIVKQELVLNQLMVPLLFSLRRIF